MTEFWVSVVSGAIGGIVGGAVGGTLFGYLWRGMNLARALRIEARGTRNLVEEALQGAEATAASARSLQRAVETAEPVTFAMVNKLDSGWVVTAPKVDFVELATWIPDERTGYAISQYFDRWTRFAEYERRYNAYWERALALLATEAPLAETARAERKPFAYSIELREQLDRVLGCAEDCVQELSVLKDKAARLQGYAFGTPVLDE